jgi:hypothetical protein
MRPQSIKDRIMAARIIKEAELFEMDLAQMILIDVIVVLCIDSWEGIEIEGQPAECTDDNKVTFAAQRPDLAIKLRLEYEKVLASAEKNLESLPDGSKMTNGQESAKTAPEVQPMKDEPQDATNAR